MVPISKNTVAENLTLFYKTEHTLQPRNFTPTQTQGISSTFAPEDMARVFLAARVLLAKARKHPHVHLQESGYTVAYSHTEFCIISEDEWTIAISNINNKIKKKANPRIVHRIYIFKSSKRTIHMIKLFFVSKHKRQKSVPVVLGSGTDRRQRWGGAFRWVQGSDNGQVLGLGARWGVMLWLRLNINICYYWPKLLQHVHVHTHAYILPFFGICDTQLKNKKGGKYE